MWNSAFMNRLISKAILIGICLGGVAVAQSPFLIASGPGSAGAPSFYLSADVAPSTFSPHADFSATAALPRMAPELALAAYQRRSQSQSAELLAYSSTTLIRAELPDTQQHGELEVARHYSAPRTLEFKSVHYSGDGFVKSNVITRLLQSEVDHVQKDDSSLTALTSANYKFSFKGTSQVDGRLLHDYQVKPRRKRAGLFKGHVYLDAYTGSLVRVEGSVVKSPSFFVKKLDFVQDYTDVAGFTLPTHMHSEALARIIGRTIVDIYQNNYQPESNTVQASQQLPTL
jgi:hypothetical protein